MSMQNKEISIIDEIISSGEYEHCIILTYNSSLSFYENIILKNLIASGCYYNVIMMDGSQYEELINEEASDIKYCGKYYSLDPVRVAGAFHPKIILLTSKTKGKVLIGSGNASFPGYGNNFELFNKFEYFEDKRKYLSVFKKVKEFISELAKRNYLNPASEKRISTIFGDANWMSGDLEMGNDLFLHNLDIPLLDQITKQLPQDIAKIVLMAPYFDSKIAVIQKLKQLYSNASVKIITQDNRTNFPIKYFIENKNSLPSVALHKFKTEDDSRRLHAKMLYFSNSSHEYLFSGSANISSPALIKNANNGNVECGIFISAEKEEGSAISSIWNKHVTKEKVNKVGDINVWEIAANDIPVRSKSIILVKGAYIKDSVLYIDYISESQGLAKILINDVEIAKENIVSGEDRIECLLDSAIKNKLSKNTNIICLGMGDNTSNKTWLHNYTIYKPGVENRITGHLDSLSGYIVNIEIAKSIIELTTPFEVKQGYENDLFKNSKLGDQEESGEQAELPEQRHFVEEKPDYQDLSAKLTSVVADDKYDIFGQLFGGMARKLCDYNRKIISKECASNDASNQEARKEELFIGDVKRKLNLLVARTVKNTLEQIDKKEMTLDISAVMAINQLAASLTWFQNGIKIEFKNEQTNVSMNKEEYLASVIDMLHRTWAETRDGDFITKDLNSDEYKLVSLVNLIALPLCLNLYLLYLIRSDDGSFSVAEAYCKKIADIFFGINRFMGRVPSDLLHNIVSADKIKKIRSHLFSFTIDFILPDLIWEELAKEPVEKNELNKALQYLALKYKQEIQRKKKVEMLGMKKDSEKLNQGLIEAQKKNNKGGGILDLYIDEQKIDKLAEEENNANAIIEAEIGLDSIGEYQLPMNIKKYFGL